MTEQSAPRRWVKYLLVAFKLIGVSVFVYLIFNLSLEDLGDLLRRVEWQYYGLAILLNLLLLNTLKVFRWHLIIRWMGVDYNYRQSYLTYQSAIFLGMMTPGRMGELMKSVYLKVDRSTPIYQGISSVLVDRLFDLVGLLTMAGLALLLTPAFGSFGAAGWYFIAAAILVSALMTALRFAPERRFRAIRIFGKGFLSKTLAGVSQQLKCLGFSRLLVIIGVTVLALGVYAVECWLIARGLGFDLELVTASGIAATATMVEVIPVTVYGLGTREAAVISLLGMIGINKTEAFSFSLMLFTNFWLFGGAWALFFWLLKPMRAKKVVTQFNKETAEEED